MKRFEDEGAYKYSFYSVLRRGEPIDVKCPVCKGHAQIVEKNGQFAWRCNQCYASADEKPLHEYRAKGNCVQCERWFNVQLTDEKRTRHKSAHIDCPYCGATNQCKLQRKPACRSYYPDTRDGRDPVFGMELYFLDDVRGKVVWALNRAHLNYLISYISADLRVRRGNVPLKTASHTIPAYMKQAKNRSDVVRTLTKLQYKTG